MLPSPDATLLDLIRPAITAMNKAIEAGEGQPIEKIAPATTDEGLAIALLRSYNPQAKAHTTPKLIPQVISPALQIYKIGPTEGILIAKKNTNGEWDARIFSKGTDPINIDAWMQPVKK